MFKKLFGKKETAPAEETVTSPVNGRIVPIEEVPDPTFGQKMIGDGLAVEPTDGHIVAPISGKIVQVFPTKHAFGIETASGAELLVHIGLETVAMNGEGFTAHVKEGDNISVGDPIIDFDLELVKAKAAHTITPVVLTNPDRYSLEKQQNSEAIAGKTALFTIKAK
ncbi:putative phosphotransferase enzyme IIA component YpqE [Shouchella clausii]|uniref:PTS sugar transporter subunit IIA n=1 Tax=Shouchella tritolerans TaxID=2979466 RepID=UPI0007898CA3|nr:PTS glucose transporter subunit IIA [Shouchella tritolerans]GIN10695.1 putative phosphotransferase enzyme IIA component YpqE [Shouchella clausii]